MSGYNLFTQEQTKIHQMIKSEGHRYPNFHKETAMKWNNMPKAEKEVYNAKADTQNRQARRELVEKERKESEAKRLAEEIEENAEKQR